MLNAAFGLNFCYQGNALIEAPPPTIPQHKSNSALRAPSVVKGMHPSAPRTTPRRMALFIRLLLVLQWEPC